MLCTMNSVARSGTLAVALLSPWTALTAEEATAPAKWSVTAECQMLVMPTKFALAEMTRLLDDDAFDKAWEEVKTKIQAGEIKVVADVVMTGEAGSKLQSSTGEEFRYPTEFNRLPLPASLLEKDPAEALKHWPGAVTPSAFETRGLGANATVTAHVSDDGKWIEASVQLQDTRFLRSAKYDEGVEQPQFFTAKDELTIHIRDGWWQLVGSHMLPSDEMELFVVRLKAKRTGGQ